MMRHPSPTILLLCALAASAISACRSAPEGGEELRGRSAAWAGDAFRNASLNQAILTQRTLYPYHFETGSPGLNDLGRRDLGVLAAHTGAGPLEINVRRGATSPALYEARVKHVLEALAAAGAASATVRDGLPGGEGLSSERVIVILKEKMSKGSSGGIESLLGSSSSQARIQ